MKRFVNTMVPVLAALCLLLSACGGSDSKAGVDPAKTAQALLDSGAFSDTLDTVELETACELYGIDPAAVTDGVVYTSLSAGAEEIAILNFNSVDSADAAEAALSALKDRVTYQTAALKDYQPEEVSKLDGAIIQRLGYSAILVVAADPALAQDVLDGLK